VNSAQRVALDEIKRILVGIGFPIAYTTDQTASCLLALSDVAAGRSDLLPGKTVLRDGARVRNILDFVRNDLQQPVAENTRESYRKDSIKPLCSSGILDCFQTSVNDPNTHYKITADFQAIIDEPTPSRRNALIATWKAGHVSRLSVMALQASADAVSVAFRGGSVSMSPGMHNVLIKAIIEVLAPALFGNFSVLYIGDTANKMLFTDPVALALLNIKLDIHDKLPDLILLSEDAETIIVVESVTSVGPISDARRDEIVKVLEKQTPLAKKLVLITAFPDRATFRKFVADIAWGTAVWIAEEGFGIIRFEHL